MPLARGQVRLQAGELAVALCHQFLETAELPLTLGYYFLQTLELTSALRRLQLPDSPEVKSSVVEFLLEGLHLNKRLNKDELEGRALYRR